MKKPWNKLRKIFHICEFNAIEKLNWENQPWCGSHKECKICGNRLV